MTRSFINRVNEIQYLKQALRYEDKENPVLVFTGIGGMGKTALRTAFEERVLVPKQIPYAVLDYETDPNVRPIEGTLRAIRRQLGRQGIKTPVFDFLFGRYFELSTGIKLSAKHYPLELEGVMTILSGLPGIDHIAKIMHGLSQLGLAVKERLQHKEWLYRLRELEPREILSLLPEVLAEDLEEAMTLQKTPVLKESGARLTLLLDAYERLSETEIDDTLHRKLMLLAPHLLRIIFTRDPLPWDQAYPKDWQGKITHYPALDVLGHDDTVMLLKKKGVKDQGMQEYLYQMTNGFPFHLELCADICREAEEMTGQPAKTADFEGVSQAKDVTQELIDLLSRQLADNEKDLMGLASYPRYITQEMLEVISSVPESVPRVFKKMVTLSMFSAHPSIEKAYVLSKEVRNYLFSEQKSSRFFKDRHKKLKEYHSEKYKETNAFHHFQEALYHTSYEDTAKAIVIFDNHFSKLLEKYNFGEAEGLLMAVPIEMLDEGQKRRVDYARAQLLVEMKHSRQSLLEAKAIYEVLIVSEKSEDLLMQYYGGLGDCLIYVDDWENSLTNYQKALAIGLKLHGEENRDVANTYNNIGWAYQVLGQCEEALVSYNKALQILSKLYGEDHPEVVLSYRGISSSFITLGWPEEALKYLNKALQITVKVFGEEHVEVGWCYFSISAAYEELGRFEEALNYLNKALKIIAKGIADDHPFVPYAYLGRLYRHLGRYEEALISSNKALQIFMGIFGEMDTDVARVYKEIGNIYRDQGRYDDALANHQKALNIFSIILVKDHPHIANVLNDIAGTLHAMKREEEALEKMGQSITIYKNFKLWKKAVKGLETLAQWYEESGNVSKALEARTEAQNIKKDHQL